MDQIIRNLAAQLGIGTDQAEAGAGAILKLIREQASAVDFQQLLSSVPGASQWMGRASAVGSEGGGLFGPAAQLLGGLTGNSNLAEAVSALGKTGIGPDAAARFVPEFLSLLQSQAGSDLVQRLVSAVPFLGQALGGQGGGGLANGLSDTLGKLFR
jgi:hypothetical protein